MKKQLLSFAVMLSATLFTACMDNDGVPNKRPVLSANGVYVAGSGNTANGIPGNLTYYDYATKSATKNAFDRVNGSSFGNSLLNDVMCYGDQTYIVADDENTVFVADAKTFELKKRINLIELMGSDKGSHPRRITANGDRIYVSTYSGYVAAIDTANYALQETYEVGSYPEGLVITGGYLFVANSDYGNGNASISMIDLGTRQVKTLTHENIRNPQEIAVNVAGSDVYYLDYGQYGAAPDYVQEHAGVYCFHLASNTVDKIVPDATGMACYGTSIFTFNNANGVEKTTYTIYDIQTKSSKTFEPMGIEIPAAIAIDPLTKYLFIASNRKLSGSAYADYSSEGFVNFYNPSTMERLGSFGCGVGPTRIAFNNSIEYIEY